MKKLFMLFSLLFMPMVALADMGAPIVKEYTVEVTNPNGVPTYERKCNNGCKLEKIKTFNYGETCVVYHEYKINGEIYLFCNNGYVRLNDLTVVSSMNFSLDDEKIEKLNQEMIADILVDKINIHNGPASAYDVIGTLEKGNTVQLIYTYSGSAWYYIEENGVSGWINEVNGELGYKANNEAILTQNANIYNYDGDKIGAIPQNTILDNYYESDKWSNRRYITYNGISGYVEEETIAPKYEKELYLIEDLKLFNSYSDALLYNQTKYNDVKDNSIGNLNKGDVVNAKYYYKYRYSTGNAYYYLINYNGSDYWVVGEPNKHDICEYYNKKIVATENIDFYADDYLNDVIGTVKKGETYTAICNNYIITTDSLQGFIRNTDIEDNTNDEKNDDEDEIIIENKSLSKNEIIYISIGLATVFVLSSIVTIILINKKKKIKNEE